MTQEQLIKERRDCNNKILNLQQRSHELNKQIEALEPEFDYESHIGKCYVENNDDEYEQNLIFYKVLKVIEENERRKTFICLSTVYLGTWNDPGILESINFEFFDKYRIKRLEEIAIEDYQEKVGQSLHHLSEIIYNNATRTPYDN